MRRISKGIFLLLLSCPVFLAPSLALDCKKAMSDRQEPSIPALSVQHAFIHLTSESTLIGQFNQILTDHHLRVPDGGLCGIVCGANLLHAGFKYLGLDGIFFENASTQAVQKMVDHIFAHYQHDARRGAVATFINRK